MHRRRYIELFSTGLLGLLAGCTGDGGGGGGGNDGDMGSTGGAVDSGVDASSGVGGADGAAGAPSDDEDIGLTAGGSQDISDFRNNVEEGYLPLPQSLSFEGLFSEYFFETGGGDSCESLFCAAYSPAVSPDPLGGSTERYFTVGLDSGRSLSAFERPNVNLVVVLDVSGSMSDQFEDYYYDQASGERQRVEGETNRRKISVARDALRTLSRQLRPGDRIGIVTFEDRAERFQEVRSVENLSMAGLRDDVGRIDADGGTNMAGGIQTGLDMLDPYRSADRSEYENRIVVVTDAQPNIGDTTTRGLRGTLERAADANLHTSFVGVGVDFNPELVDRITSVRGSNYYTVRSAEQFQRRMGEEFAFMVTPLVFDLSVELEPGGTEIVDVYGTSVDDAATEDLLHVPTLFPSPTEGGRTRGGVILVEVNTAMATSPPEVRASYETRAGQQRTDRATVEFPSGIGAQYANTGVRKSVLLTRYAQLLRNWMVYERDADPIEEDGGIEAPPDSSLGRWEQTSEPLTVSTPYDIRIPEFREHFRSEMRALGDDDLQQELEMIDAILAAE